MKRIFAFLLALSMMLSLTLPAAAEETVEEITEVVEEVAEEVIEEEAIEEEVTEEVAEEVIEAVTEEVTEEVAEEVVEEVVFEEITVSDDVAAAEAEVECQACGVPAEECKAGHYGPYTLWLHEVNGPAFLTDVTLWLDESITVRAVVGNYFSQYPVYMGNDEADALAALDYDKTALKVTVSYPDDADMYLYTITPLRAGDWTISYTDAENNTYSVRIHALGAGDAQFYATDAGGGAYYDQHTPLQMSTNMTVDHLFYIRTSDGTQTVDPAKLYTTTDMISITPNGDVAEMLMVWGAKGQIYYDHTDGKTYVIPALSYGADTMAWDNTLELLSTESDGTNLRYSESLTVGATVERSFRIGSAGASVPVKKELTADGTVLEILSVEDGVYTIKTLAEGTGYITDGSSYYYVTVEEMVVGDEMLFHGLGWDPSGNTVRTYIEIPLNNSQSYAIHFGTSDDNVAVHAKNVTLVGDVVTMDTYYDEGNDVTYFTLAAVKEGFGQLVYKADNGLEYVMPIKVYSGNYDNSNMMARNYMEFQSTNGTVKAGIGQLKGESLAWASQFGGYYDQDEDPNNDMDFIHTLGLLVMENGSPVDISELKDVRCQVLSCNDNSTDNLGDMVFTNSVTVSPARDHTVSAANLTTKVTQVNGAQKESFSATIAFSYTFRGQRFTQQVWCFQTPNGDVTINADDLTDSGRLNVVLSSWEALTKWAKEVHGKNIEVGNFINLYLPAVEYEDIIVAQAQSPFKSGSGSNPISHIRLNGMNNQGQQATMVGLIEKCCLNVVDGITFVADPEKTMTTTENGSETFTCGVLADYRNTTRPVYDEAYLDAYCGGAEPSLELPYVDTYKNAGLLQVCIDIGGVNNCNFQGFDYGVRSTLYGHAGSQTANTYRNCYYGIYINNDGHEIDGGDIGGDAGNGSHVDYSYLTFENNMYAVRMKSIPNDAIPYNTRVRDSNFIDNYREFWIEEPGTYYFYRNYFGGKWHEHDHHGRWHKHYGHRPDFDDRDNKFELGSPRCGRVHYSRNDVKIIINPCRRSGDFYDTNYWIYSGDDQHTAIERGTSMPISGDAVKELDGRADVELVDGNGKAMITYTFHGKGGAQ